MSATEPRHVARPESFAVLSRLKMQTCDVWRTDSMGKTDGPSAMGSCVQEMNRQTSPPRGFRRGFAGVMKGEVVRDMREV